MSGYHHHIHMVGKFPISQEKERFDRTVHGYDCSWEVSKTLFRFLILRRASMTSSAPTSNLRCTWRDAWRQPCSQPLPLLSYLSPSPTCPSSSRKRYWSSEPPSACSCSSQCEQNFPFKLNFTKISFSTRSALMASHRMPLSYLTLLDIRLIQIQI